MIYLDKNYSWVTEKKINGVLHQVYRCDTNPKKCILIVGENITDFDIKDWGKI